MPEMTEQELEEAVWQLFAGCVLDCRQAGKGPEHADAVIDKYVSQALALINKERNSALRAKLGELYSLAPEIRSPLWRNLGSEVSKLRAQG